MAVDVESGRHRPVAFDVELVCDAAEDSPLASVQPAVEIGFHSKASWGRTVEGVKSLNCSPRPAVFELPGFDQSRTTLG